MADCQTRDASESGEYSSLKEIPPAVRASRAEDRRTQAILPLKGKILNVERTTIDKMLAFKEIKALVIALGAGIAEEFDISKLRYHKIIIAYRCRCGRSAHHHLVAHFVFPILYALDRARLFIYRPAAAV